LVGSYGRTQRDMAATLDWLAQGRLRATIEEVLPLDRGREAFLRLRERRVRGKLVLVPARGWSG